MSKEFHLPKNLTPRQLWMMANDPDWFQFLDLIAAHPHAYPTLIQWVSRVQQDGIVQAGGAPEPDADVQSRSRVFFKARIPIPPSVQDACVDDVLDPMVRQERIVPNSYNEVFQEEAQDAQADSPVIDTTRDTRDVIDEVTRVHTQDLFDSDDSDDVFDDEESSSSYTGGFLPLLTRTVSKRGVRVGILIGVLLLIVLLAAGMLMGKTARHAESTNRDHRQVSQQLQAYQNCKTVYEQAVKSRKAWIKIVNQVDAERQIMEVIGISASELDAYNQAVADPMITIRACKPSMTSEDLRVQTRELRSTSRVYKVKTGKLTKTVDLMRERQVKLLIEARNLAEQAKGKVANQATLDRLNHAITEKQYARLCFLMRQVHESMQKEGKTDQHAPVSRPLQASGEHQDSVSQQPMLQSVRPPITPRTQTPYVQSSAPDWHVPDSVDHEMMPNRDPSL